MEPTELIAALQSRLSARLPAEVRTNPDNERPMPAVILDDTVVTDHTFHNTPLAQHVETNSGSDERYFRFYYDLRLDYTVRHTSDPNVSMLFDDLRQEFMALRLNPASLDADIHDVNLRGGGQMTSTFTEESESEMTQSVEFATFHQVSRTNYDTIADIQKTFNLS